MKSVFYRTFTIAVELLVGLAVTVLLAILVLPDFLCPLLRVAAEGLHDPHALGGLLGFHRLFVEEPRAREAPRNSLEGPGRRL